MQVNSVRSNHVCLTACHAYIPFYYMIWVRIFLVSPPYTYIGTDIGTSTNACKHLLPACVNAASRFIIDNSLQ